MKNHLQALPAVILFGILAAGLSGEIALPHSCSVDETSTTDSPFPLYATLGWLVHPMPAKQFLQDYYQQLPIHFKRRNQSHHTHHLHKDFNFHQEINAIVGRRSKAKKYMAARATRTGQDVGPFHYWHSPEVVASTSYTQKEIKRGQKTSDTKALWDPAALDYLYKEGFSLQYPAIEGYWKQPHLFTALMNTLGIYSQLNLYVTPKREKGFKAHFDSHDVFVLQTRGSKHWKVYSVPEGVRRHPVTDWSDSKLETVRSTLTSNSSVIDVVLETGDALYIPRGYMHEAECDQGEDGSTHVTIGFMTMKTADLLYVAVRESKTLALRVLKRFQKYLIAETKRNVELRRSVLGSSIEQNQHTQQHTAPVDRLVRLYTEVVTDFLSTDVVEEKEKSSHSKLLLTLTPESKIKTLGNGLKWRKKTMKKLAKRSVTVKLSKLRPITHSMQEKRKPVELTANGGRS